MKLRKGEERSLEKNSSAGRAWQAYMVEKPFAFMLNVFDVEWTGLQEEANCVVVWVVLCLLGDF